MVVASGKRPSLLYGLQADKTNCAVIRTTLTVRVLGHWTDIVHSMASSTHPMKSEGAGNREQSSSFVAVVIQQSMDDLEQEKLQRRRKQKRDSARKRRGNERQSREHLKIENGKLKQQKKELKTQVEQLRTWKYCAESYLQTCKQLLASSAHTHLPSPAVPAVCPPQPSTSQTSMAHLPPPPAPFTKPARRRPQESISPTVQPRAQLSLPPPPSYTESVHSLSSTPLFPQQSSPPQASLAPPSELPASIVSESGSGSLQLLLHTETNAVMLPPPPYPKSGSPPPPQRSNPQMVPSHAQETAYTASRSTQPSHPPLSAQPNPYTASTQTSGTSYSEIEWFQEIEPPQQSFQHSTPVEQVLPRSYPDSFSSQSYQHSTPVEQQVVARSYSDSISSQPPEQTYVHALPSHSHQEMSPPSESMFLQESHQTMTTPQSLSASSFPQTWTATLSAPGHQPEPQSSQQYSQVFQSHSVPAPSSQTSRPQESSWLSQPSPVNEASTHETSHAAPPIDSIEWKETGQPVISQQASPQTGPSLPNTSHQAKTLNEAAWTSSKAAEDLPSGQKEFDILSFVDAEGSSSSTPQKMSPMQFLDEGLEQSYLDTLMQSTLQNLFEEDIQYRAPMPDAYPFEGDVDDC